jgi:hypothetical protein
MMLPGFADPAFGYQPAGIGFSLRCLQRCTPGTNRKDLSHPFGFCLVDHQTSTLRINVIAQHRISACPLSLAPGRRQLVARSLADDLPLELGKRQ